MKFLATLLTAAGMAAAQTGIGDVVPSCALYCINIATLTATTCATNDPPCQCEYNNYVAIYLASMTCVISRCGFSVAIGEYIVPVLGGGKGADSRGCRRGVADCAGVLLEHHRARYRLR